MERVQIDSENHTYLPFQRFSERLIQPFSIYITLIIGMLLFTPWVVLAQDVTSLVTVTASNNKTTLNSVTRTYTTTIDISIVNKSSQAINAPLHAVIDITSSGGTVTMPEAIPGPGTGLYGKYYYDLSSRLQGGLFTPQ